MVDRQAIERAEIWWADLPQLRRSKPGFERPVLIIQSAPFNQSRLSTVIIAVMSSNLSLAKSPGNVLVPARSSRLPKDSVVNISQIMTVDRSILLEFLGTLAPRYMAAVDEGLRQILTL